jgi:hypothetical protein
MLATKPDKRLIGYYIDCIAIYFLIFGVLRKMTESKDSFKQYFSEHTYELLVSEDFQK